MVIPGLWFYVISLIGIYFVSLGHRWKNQGAASKFLSFLGRYSFEIVEIHFAVFKFVDYAYAKFWLRSVPENLAGFRPDSPMNSGHCTLSPEH